MYCPFAYVCLCICVFVYVVCMCMRLIVDVCKYVCLFERLFVCMLVGLCVFMSPCNFVHMFPRDGNLDSDCIFTVVCVCLFFHLCAWVCELSPFVISIVRFIMFVKFNCVLKCVFVSVVCVKSSFVRSFVRLFFVCFMRSLHAGVCFIWCSCGCMVLYVSSWFCRCVHVLSVVYVSICVGCFSFVVF